MNIIVVEGIMRVIGLASCLLMLFPLYVSGQDQSPPVTPRFEVASVRANQSADPIGGLRPTPGRFASINTPLRQLITYAYGIFAYQLVDAPAWVQSERFDINAVMPDGVRGQERQMMKTLLAERFGLKVREETRTMAVYALVRKDPARPLGPNLRPLDEVPDPRACATVIRPGLISAKCSNWQSLRLANQLFVDRPVIDRTELNGVYEVRLEWSPDMTVSAPEPVAGQPIERVSLFTALDEQLGLRLVQDSAPVSVVVVESISRPAPEP
jgi:uncharacterized protein (TIGR03435 family)